MKAESEEINSNDSEDNDDYLKGDIEIGVALNLLVEAFLAAGVDVYLMGFGNGPN